MKIGLISVGSYIDNGLRTISSYLKLHGHEVILLFFAKFEYYPHISFQQFTQINLQPYLLELFKDCSLIGISCLTINSFESAHIINLLRPLNIPIIWGGVHATLSPENCLEYNDIICRGEGEEAFLEIIDKLEKRKDIYDTLNFWFKKSDGTIIKNPLRQLIQDIDSIPSPDYTLKNHYLFNGLKIVKSDPSQILSLHVYTSYGCPHSCTYCVSAALDRTFNSGKKRRIRKKSVNKIIKDLKENLSTLTKIKNIFFDDDTFLIRNTKELEEFAKQYKIHIKLPFTIFVSPGTVTQKKLEILIDAGMSCFEMGIESGSDRINKEIFKRPVISRKVLETLSFINTKYKNKFTSPPVYDIIVRNPYDKDEDILNSLRLFTQLPKPYLLTVCSLTFFPKTEIYKMAYNEGLIKKTEKEIIYDLNINTKNVLISPVIAAYEKRDYINLYDVIILMNGIIYEKFYNFIPADLLDTFLEKEHIYGELKINIPYEIENKMLKNQFWKGIFLPGMNPKTLLYILKVYIFLRQNPQNVLNNSINSNLNDLEILEYYIREYYKMIVDFHKYYGVNFN